MHQSDILAYYCRKDIQREIVAAARGREVAESMRDGSFMSRPDMLLYPADVLDRVKRGAVAFHCSVERWSSPLALKSANLDELRTGWDLIIDIDAKAKFEHARQAAAVLIDFLKEYGISPTIKFSGRRGFHIAIAAEAFPKEIDFKPIAQQYPGTPKAILRFIKSMCAERILESLIDYEGGLAALSKCLPSLEELSPYQFLDIETDWGSRHLFRAPYSLNEKSWLVSLPIRIFKLKSFKPELAAAEKVKPSAPFLINKQEEASELLIAALDWAAKHKPAQPAPRRACAPATRIPQDCFPPCIKAISDGLADGKKRSIFTLAAFLHSVNWKPEAIEKFILDANKKNRPKLTERFIRTQLKWHERNKMLPPNCGSELFYRSIGICKPDRLCKGIKNPINYAIKAFRGRSYAHKLRKHKASAQSRKS